MLRFASFLVLVLATGSAMAQTPGEYSLDQGIIKFNAPSAWPVIMQKSEGDPQFVAFQVKDPADTGSGEATRVTVETRLLNDSSNFQPMVNRDVDKAKQMPGYEQRTDGVDSTTLRYFARNGKTKYEYRETWYLNSHLLVHVRCARPLLDKTTAQWTADYEKGCSQIMSSLKPH
ncbi:MAG: hypothetical protein JSR27_08090 [Proteobacteria bacterium]|nr:hypothetical protein [Pseudomonadota bacterium]